MRLSAFHKGVALMVVALAGILAPTAIAGSQTPFSAALSGSATTTGCGFLTICLAGTDQGIATHLGFATLTSTATVQITSTPCDGGGVLTNFMETATLTAANGDTLTLSGSGTACVVAGHAIATAELTVTGGTGRFAGATGSLAESIDHNLATNAETVNLSGTISTPGSTA
jgi:hypothetical protein